VLLSLVNVSRNFLFLFALDVYVNFVRNRRPAPAATEDPKEIERDENHDHKNDKHRNYSCVAAAFTFCHKPEPSFEVSNTKLFGGMQDLIS